VLVLVDPAPFTAFLSLYDPLGACTTVYTVAIYFTHTDS
jgi:hypothetical protein